MYSDSSIVLITGGSGLVGSRLSALLRSQGTRVRTLSRSSTDDPDTFQWQPERGEHITQNKELEKAFNKVNAVIHLSGENVASWFWTKKQKKKILESRVNGTKAICALMKQYCSSDTPLFCASAIGIYPQNQPKVAETTAAANNSFLANVVEAWEDAANSVESQRRVIVGRFGLVLSTEGGLLSKILPLFRLGLGGKLGSGKQVMSWIEITDLCRAILFLLERPDAAGAYNIVAPQPVTNLEFTNQLATALNRPALLPVPKLFFQTIFGKEMTEDLFFSDIDASSDKLGKLGFDWKHSTLNEALVTLIGHSK